MQFVRDDGARNLADGIINQAANDYVRAIKCRSKGSIRELEKFFRSEWYRHLTSIDCEFLIQKLREKARDEIKAEAAQRSP